MVEIHPLADVKQATIGNRTRVWQFAIVLDGAVIGEDCNICAHTLIEGKVVIGSYVTIKSGVYIWDGITIEDYVFLGPNVTFTNDLFPRSKQYPSEFIKTKICHNASIGANATILAGITIGEYAMVGAGSVVTKNVPPYAVVVGNPARIVRFLEKN